MFSGSVFELVTQLALKSSRIIFDLRVRKLISTAIKKSDKPTESWISLTFEEFTLV